MPDPLACGAITSVGKTSARARRAPMEENNLPVKMFRPVHRLR